MAVRRGGVVGCDDGMFGPREAPEAVDRATSAAAGAVGRGPPVFIVTVEDGHLPLDVAARFDLEPTHVYSTALLGFAAPVSEMAREGLLRGAGVRRVERDLAVTTFGDQADPPWGLDRIDQRAATLDGMFSTATTGAGVTAYVIDTGINADHQEFGGRATSAFDATGGDGDDCNGHGTHVAGTIGGATFGVAKQVAIRGVRVLDCAGSGTVADVIAGVDWVAANAVLPAVANMSLGGGVSSSLDEAVAALVASGVPTAVAAGNSTQSACDASPAREPSAMTVGATQLGDARAHYSNVGSCVDWFAPGSDVLSAWHETPDATASLSGTSMAAPHTAGVAALLLEAVPGMTPTEVRDSLFSFTTKDIVVDAFSPNAHLLSSVFVHDAEGEGPPATSIATPTGVSASASTDVLAGTVRWQTVDGAADYVQVGLRGPDFDWRIVKRQAAFLRSYDQYGLEPASTYEFRVRALKDLGSASIYSEWSDPVAIVTCDGNPNSGKCSGGGGSDSDGSSGSGTKRGGQGKGKNKT